MMYSFLEKGGGVIQRGWEWIGIRRFWDTGERNERIMNDYEVGVHRARSMRE
jgi:hypothetical protein